MKKTIKKKRQLLCSFYGIVIMLLCFNTNVSAQNLLVTGVVTDEADGLPIPGVSIVVKGTQNGTITNIDGAYSIKAKTGDVLVYSFVGMKIYEQNVTSSQINVAMESESIGLDEVVAIGYGSVKKKEITGAVAHVKAEDLSRVITSDLGTALQGQVAGVNVTASSGAPGAQSEILIRGISSINGESGPLWVVDGVPQEGDPGINPNEIASLDILKDAASCAIYGTRGAGGVILVTTKGGQAGSLKINVNASYGIQNIRSNTYLMDAVEQTYFDKVMLRNLEGATDDQASISIQKQPYAFQNNTDLSKHVFVDNAPVQDYSVNISGGTKDITYSVVAGYYGKKGSLINSDFDRFTTRANTTYKNGRWRIQANVGLKTEKTAFASGGLLTQAIIYNPTMMDYEPGSNEPLEVENGLINQANWVIQSFNNEDNQTANSAFTNFNINFNLLEGLDINTRFAYNFGNNNRKQFHPYQEVYDLQGNLLSDPLSSSVTQISGANEKITSETMLTYKKWFGKHSINAMGVFTIEESSVEGFYGRKYGVIDNSIKVLNGTTLNPDTGSEWPAASDGAIKRIGTLGRIMYNYDEKYLLNVSGRYDGSSKFKKQKWGYFPSISAGWNISQEDFWQGIAGTINSAKLRVSRGTVGNQNIPNYTFAAGITQGLDYAFGAEGSDVLGLGSAQTSYANEYVGWETKIEYNLGLDLAFKNNRITFTAEYYNTQHESLLFPVQAPGSAGVGNESVTLNLGNMTNSGLEFSLGYRDKVGKLGWGINSTYAYNQNEVTKLTGLTGVLYMDDWGLVNGAKDHSQITVLAEGYEAGAFYLYRTDGILDTPEKLANYQKLVPTARMGDLKYIDQNNDGQISEEDRVYSGSGLPQHTINLNVNLDYKGFDFSMQWYSALGHEIMNGANAMAFGYGRHKDLLYQWSEANPTSTIPAYRGDIKEHPNYKGYTDLWLEDGSYLRLKQVTLGYSFSANTLDKIGLGKCRIYLTAQNPLTFTKYTGYDPEVGGGLSSRGLDKGNYPVTAMYMMGINLNF
ncbi:SusC/RagA family TonB-linked outer membrane protein [Saccharicrinis aurantiacus]|uniref:SusC/RagA family TonB-linked outer membrane protein n=1 Tax=Saccharicrinis aurantiacus TaxID=1849719 RepID=UPI0008393E96|nr:TonB-dependent receptor [Saccharicrinis aurantiacus]